MTDKILYKAEVETNNGINELSTNVNFGISETEFTSNYKSMLYLWKKITNLKILKKLSKGINFRKVRDYCNYTDKHRGIAESICNLIFNMPNEIPVVFHNGSNYDYHFII